MNISFRQQVKQRDIRIFGYIWAAIFLFTAFYPLIKGSDIRLWAAITGTAFLIIGTFFPPVLKYFYIAWVKFGELTGNIISKIALFFIFFLLITPMGIIMRLAGKDFLNKEFDKNAATYWINRESQPASMKNQF